MPAISILIPVYNMHAYLSECLDSLLAQDFQNWEAVCVNDGSTDDSLDILNTYAQKDKRFIVISQENKGLSSTRNILLQHFSGDWALFLDSDDTLVPKALSTLYNIAQRSQQDVIITASFGVTGETLPEPTRKYEIYSPALPSLLKRRHLYSSTCGKLYKRSILMQHKFIPGIYFEDWPFITVLFAHISGFAVTDDKLYLYRRTPNSIVRSAFSTQKIDSYMMGVEFVCTSLFHTSYMQLAKKRCSVAVRMCINKTWRDKEQRKTLAPYLIQQISSAYKKGYFSWHYVSFKTIMRYIIMKRYNH